MKNKYKYIAGFFIGLINSLLGACGGIITVFVLKKDNMSQKNAHANAIAVILPLTIISTVFYYLNGNMTISESLIYIPGGIAGAIAGGIFLKNINQNILRKIFSIFIIWAGIRMIAK